MSGDDLFEARRKSMEPEFPATASGQTVALFKEMDTDHSGTVSGEELRKKLLKDTELQKLLDFAGLNHKWYVFEQVRARKQRRAAHATY